MITEEEKKLIEEGICPVCKNDLVRTEGCIECKRCGWSACQEA